MQNSPELTILPLNTENAEQENANGKNTFLSGLGNYSACSHNHRMTKNNDCSWNICSRDNKDADAVIMIW